MEENVFIESVFEELKKMSVKQKDAFAFLNRVFRGCHDLVRLGEYQLAGKILDQVS